MAISLRTARRLAKLTQPALAELSGVSQTTISALEREVSKKPTWDTCVRLAKALGVDPHEIFEVPDVPNEATR